MPEQFVWLIFLLPLLSFAVIALVIKPFFKAKIRLSGYTAIAAIGASALLSLWALTDVMAADHHIVEMSSFEWLSIGQALNINVGIILDPLTVIMLVVITSVSLMVQIYSQGYMQGDPGYQRYYAYMSLFTTSMLGLVLVDNLLLMFVFWELVGLCSYLLIGFWFQKPSAANAAKKAFIVTRVGDFGFLAAIVLLLKETGTLEVAQLNGMAELGLIGATVLTLSGLGIFLGAMGKSAQFPLHVWLPDAMEGPTPVSALIHAATMVAAGVFLVARTYPIFAASETVMTTVGIIGAITCIFAASIGLVMNDIKRVLAYSTISQLGYMMLGLATGGVAVGMFHLLNHAFFKSLLFLGSGNVNHATGTFDMRKMGGLKKIMPWTYRTFLIASISMAGIWPLSGFWSKDEILATAWHEQPLLFWLALITVFMTAFYIFRVIFMTFHGEYRGEGHPHESPRVMIAPLIFLAMLAVFSGLVNVNGGFGSFMGHGETKGFLEGFFGIFGHWLTWVSLGMAGGGIFMAYAVYQKNWISAKKLGRTFAPLYKLFSRKYWMDELYEDVITRFLLFKGAFKGLYLFDTHVVDGGINGLLIENALMKRLFPGMRKTDDKVVDGAVNAIADGTVAIGDKARKSWTGQLQLYGMFFAIGVVVIIASVYLLA